jgi:homoserine O-acetyltransferase
MIYQTNIINLEKFELINKKIFIKPDVCYTLYGNLNNGKKLALFFHGFSSGTLLHDWWCKLPLDEILKTHNIICFNSLGSCHGSLGPITSNPQTGYPYLGSFPQITIQDTVNFIVESIKELQLEKIDLVLGCSLGGMQAIDMFLRFPELSDKYISVCGSPLPYMTKLINIAQYNIISEGIDNNLCEKLLKIRMGFSRYIFRLSCTTESALKVLAHNETKITNYNQQKALENYFLNDSLKYENDFSPFSYRIYMKMLANFELDEFQINDKHFNSEIILVNILGDKFTPPECINNIFNLLKLNNYNVTGKTFDTLYGHEAWILDGEKFYEIIKSEFASESMVF